MSLTTRYSKDLYLLAIQLLNVKEKALADTGEDQLSLV